MNPNQKLKNYIKALEAFLNGKPIQVWGSSASWSDWKKTHVPMFEHWEDFRETPNDIW